MCFSSKGIALVLDCAKKKVKDERSDFALQ